MPANIDGALGGAEEHIEKNPMRYWKGQLGLDMGDYLSSEPNHHFNKCVALPVRVAPLSIN